MTNSPASVTPSLPRGPRGSTPGAVRAHNERLVLSLLRRHGPLPKATLARLTGLSAQTVTVLTRALERDGLIARGTPVRGRVGQPSVPMALRPEGACFLGLKIGRRSLEMLLIDFLGAPLGRIVEHCPFATPDQALRFAQDAHEQLLRPLPAAQRKGLAGMGVALPFRAWDWPGGAGSLDAWRDRDIAADLANQLGLPVTLQNDASAACGAELAFGPQDNPSDFLYLFVGYFIGGGLVLDHQLFDGRSGNAAALGSMPLAGGAQLVDRASLATLEQALIHAGHDTAWLWQAPDTWPLALHDPAIVDWLDGAADAIAQAIRAASCVIDLDSVLIDGWLPERLRTRLVEATARHLTETPLAGVEMPTVRPGTIGPQARTLGAASLPLSKRFLVNRSAFLKG